jgi:TPP-dependent pyruvate/acetoin dehydrogenase alpha subunit
MSTAHPVQPHPSSALQRTELLHRMLLVRHLTNHHAAAPGTASGDFQVHFHAGEEAVAAGVLAALGPSVPVRKLEPSMGWWCGESS